MSIVTSTIVFINHIKAYLEKSKTNHIDTHTPALNNPIRKYNNHAKCCSKSICDTIIP